LILEIKRKGNKKSNCLHEHQGRRKNALILFFVQREELNCWLRINFHCHD